MAERRYQVVFYVAILIAAMGTYGVYRVLEATRANNRIAMAPVVVANEDMADGITVTRSNVSTKPWPAQTIPPGAYASVDSVVGRVTRVPVFRGEPMVPGRLAPAGTGGGLEVKIGPGKRAMSVKINDVNGISGLLQPNSRVDVLVTIRDESNSEARGRSVAKLFMSNMRVLSVGARVQRADDNGRGAPSSTATLEVTPEEAERLAVAQNQGSIQLVLRGYGDPDSIRTKGATSTDVLAQLREGQTVTVTPPVAAGAEAPQTAGQRSRGRRSRWSSLRRRCRHPSHAPTPRRSPCTGPGSHRSRSSRREIPPPPVSPRRRDDAVTRCHRSLTRFQDLERAFDSLAARCRAVECLPLLRGLRRRRRNGAAVRHRDADRPARGPVRSDHHAAHHHPRLGGQSGHCRRGRDQ